MDRAILTLDKTHLALHSVNNSSGSINIKNTGGVTLSGHILLRTDAITATPSSFTSNSLNVIFSLSPDYRFQDYIETVAYICTNGGEFELPITITHAPMAIPTEEGKEISSIQDFYYYSKTYPVAARRLFASSEFYMLLLSTGYEFMEVYESLHKDPNRERAMDNFFMVSGLKGKTSLALEKQSIDIVARGTNKIYESIIVQKSDSGYADAPVTAKKVASWLNLSTSRLASSDFDENNRSLVGFSIDPLRISEPFVKEHILIGQELFLLTVRRGTQLSLKLNRKNFRYEDRGSVEVENHTGLNLTLDVYCHDRYVRFHAISYLIEGRHSIPFEIRPTALASAQRLFRRLPYISTYIDVRAHGHGREFRKRLHLTIGEW